MTKHENSKRITHLATTIWDKPLTKASTNLVNVSNLLLRNIFEENKVIG